MCCYSFTHVVSLQRYWSPSSLLFNLIIILTGGIEVRSKEYSIYTQTNYCHFQPATSTRPIRLFELTTSVRQNNQISITGNRNLKNRISIGVQTWKAIRSHMKDSFNSSKEELVRTLAILNLSSALTNTHPLSVSINGDITFLLNQPEGTPE